MAEAVFTTSESLLRTSFDIESTPLLPVETGTSRGGAAIRPPAEEESVDWTMTTLLFLFPAIGGMLFG